MTRDVPPGREEVRCRRGPRREYDARRPSRSFEARVDGVVRDVGAFRAMALQDLVARQFDGHPFVARQGLAWAERHGWVTRETVYV